MEEWMDGVSDGGKWGMILFIYFFNIHGFVHRSMNQ